MSTTNHPDRARIVVGVDGSTESVQALRWAARFGPLLGADIEATGVWQLPVGYASVAAPYAWDPRQELVDAISTALKTVFDTTDPDGVQMVVRQGNPAKELLEQAEDALMIVVGSRGRGGFTGLLLGSVSSSVSAHAQCPVLVTHGEDLPSAAPA